MKTTAESSPFRRFLLDSAATNAREMLVESGFLFDMKLAAAKCGYGLVVSNTETDTDGYDLVLDDRLSVVPVQLKSTATKTNSWKIHRRLLRPKLDQIHLFGLSSSSHHAGLAGCVVVVLLEPLLKGQPVQYLFTDYLLLEACRAGVHSLGTRQRKPVERARMNLLEKPKGQVVLPRAAFVKSPSSESLLALVGLSSQAANGWRNSMRMYLQLRSKPAPLAPAEADEREFYRQLASDELKAILQRTT